jgi:hypothetical protein
MEGKQNPNAPIFVNKAVVQDLMWFHAHVEKALGIHLLKSLEWDPIDADCVLYCDALLTGMGFYDDKTYVGCQSSLPENAPQGNIFYFEVFCVCWALLWMASEFPATRLRVTVFTDSTNTFDIFNSLGATLLYNKIVKTAVNT